MNVSENCGWIKVTVQRQIKQQACRFSVRLGLTNIHVVWQKMFFSRWKWCILLIIVDIVETSHNISIFRFGEELGCFEEEILSVYMHHWRVYRIVCLFVRTPIKKHTSELRQISVHLAYGGASVGPSMVVSLFTVKYGSKQQKYITYNLSLIHISEPTRPY